MNIQINFKLKSSIDLLKTKNYGLNYDSLDRFFFTSYRFKSYQKVIFNSLEPF